MSNERFEIEDRMLVNYKYHYGGVTPFFESLAGGGPRFRISICESCGLQYCPPRYHCQKCWKRTGWTEHDGTGKIEVIAWAYWMPYDSTARQWTDLPYAYGAIRLAGCANLLRVRVTGADQNANLAESVGLEGDLRVVPNPSGRLGDLYFKLREGNGNVTKDR